ncbi:MAG: CoA-disulfide reductase [Atopostipes suicloacalis]|nr:CoA-disulfide reductase [Atopostipes suicloacalis]
MEIVIIGGIAAGMGTAAKAARENPGANITVIEKEDYISFGACGLPYYLGGQFDDSNKMFARTVEQIRNQGINVKVSHEAIGIDYDKKTVYYKNLKNEEKLSIVYDRLVITSGAQAIIPNIKGVDAENVYTFTRLKSVRAMKDKLDSINKVTIVGGGFIGVEVAEQLAHLGKEVTVIEGLEGLMANQFDPEFSEKIKGALEEEKVEVVLDEFVEELLVEDNRVKEVKTSGQSIPTDLVVLAVGFLPNTNFAKDEKLKMLDNGAIVINQYGETSIPDVFSAGDSTSSYHRLLGTTYTPLATIASKMARVVAVNVASENTHSIEYPGHLGTGAVKVGNFEAGSTGINEADAKGLGIDYKTTSITASNHTGYWPNRTPIDIKLVYEAKSKKLLGAQVFGEQDAVLRLTGLTTAIHAELTTDEIGFIDYSYAPPFATTFEAINIAANTAK